MHGPVADVGDPQRYRGLEVELLAESLVRWLSLEPWLGGGFPAPRPALRMPGRAALTALVHFCGIVLDPGTHPLVLEHQLEGFLLALTLEKAVSAAGIDCARAQLDPILAMRQLVRTDPRRVVSLREISRKLGVSSATLRRRLSRQGTGFRRILHEERMLIARTLLGDGRLNVTEVAARCGYGSPGKFSRRFRQAFGVLPSRFRAGQGAVAS